MPIANAPANRAKQFARLDVNNDQQLTREEFGASRKPEEADRFFKLRDVDGNKLISREEFLPAAPVAK